MTLHIKEQGVYTAGSTVQKATGTFGLGQPNSSQATSFQFQRILNIGTAQSKTRGFRTLR